jgi:hypothetical protein
MSISNSITTTIESWFIPVDIYSIICLAMAIILATIFLFIIIVDKTCHTVPMLLIANTCLTGLVCASNTIAMTIFTLQNDLKQIQYQDSLCIVRGYLSYVLCAVHNYSYLIQAMYRYAAIIYPARLFWQSTRTQIFLIALSWTIAFLFPIVFIFNGAIIYNVNNQICQVPLGFSFSIIYAPHCVFIIPVSLVIFIYLRLVRYVRGMSKRVTLANTLLRAGRNLRMVRQTVILTMILSISGIPYSLFIFLSFANLAPTYNFRIAYIFANSSLTAVMIALFQFTDSLKTPVKKIICGRPNIVIPTVT